MKPATEKQQAWRLRKRAGLVAVRVSNENIGDIPESRLDELKIFVAQLAENHQDDMA